MSNKWLRAVWGAYWIIGLGIYLQLFFGLSFFATTIYTYSLLALIIWWVVKRLEISQTVSLSFMTMILALFISECVLRFVVKYPMSYSEKNWGEYLIPNRYQKRANLRFRWFSRRTTMHTLVYEPNEIRSYQSVDFNYGKEECNAQGLRGKLPLKGKRVVVIVGDSFTEGYGAPSDSTYPVLVEQHLMTVDSAYSVLNAGVCGSDLFFDWERVQDLNKEFIITDLLFTVNTTDITDIATKGASKRFLNDETLSINTRPWWEPIYAVSYLVRLIAHNAFNLDYNLKSESEVHNANTLALHQMKQLMTCRIIPWAEQHKIRVTVVLHPLKQEISDDTLMYDALRQAMFDVKGLSIIDCRPVIANSPESEFLYWKNDLHFKPEGYKIVANTVFKNYSWRTFDANLQQ